jgi:hypothetical protein
MYVFASPRIKRIGRYWIIIVIIVLSMGIIMPILITAVFIVKTAE